MAYFKPKTKVSVLKDNQPFYECMRGGTAPHESRKVAEQMKHISPQSPQGSIFMPTEAIIKPPKAQFVVKNNLQEITKIYNCVGPVKIVQKRKSTESQRPMTDAQGQFRLHQFNVALQPNRTQTSQQHGHPIKMKQNNEDKRPISQELNGRWKFGQTTRQFAEDRNYQGEAEIDLDKDNIYDRNMMESMILFILYTRLTEEDSNQQSPTYNQDITGYRENNLDAASNESQRADSRRNSLSPNAQKDDEIANRSVFHQREDAQILESLRKTTVNQHRPMTSEGGRRKRFNHNLTQQESQEQEQFSKTNDLNSVTLQQYDNNNQRVEYQSTQKALFATEEQLFGIRIEKQVIENDCQIIQDFDEDFFVKDNNNSPSQSQWNAGGFRRKITETEQSQNYNEPSNNNQTLTRPPSRSKIPPQSVGLEVPPNSHDMNDIPIRNMYVNMDVEPSFEDNFKMNNNVNITNFMKQTGPIMDIKAQKIEFNKRQASAIFVTPSCSTQRNQPQSANNTKFRGQKNYQPTNAMNSQTSKAAQTVSLSSNNFEIVIKHNTSSNFQKTLNNNPVKVPFQTSLGQDFLRLFANQHIAN